MNDRVLTSPAELVARSSANITATDIITAVHRMDFDPHLESQHSARGRTARAAGVDVPEPGRFAFPVELRDAGVKSFEARRRPPVRRTPESARAPRSLRAPQPPSAPAGRGLDLDSPPDAAELAAISRGAGSPRLAAGLSLAFPGLGHFYAGEWTRAAFLALAFALAARGVYASPWPALTLVSGLLGAALWVHAARDAFAAVLRETPWGAPRNASSPRLAPILSATIPGWGQFLNDEPAKAAFFLTAVPAFFGALLLNGPQFAGFAWAPMVSVACAGAGLLLGTLSVYDAALIAKQRSRRRVEGQ